MTNFALLYPSMTLASLFDPADSLVSGKNRNSLEAELAEECRRLIGTVNFQQFAGTQGESDRWYLRGRGSQDPQDGPENGRPDLPVQGHAAGHQAGHRAADSSARLQPGRPARVHPGGVRLVELPPAPVRHRRRAVRPTGPQRHGLRPGDDRRDGRASQQADPEVGPEVTMDLRVRLRRRLAA